MGFQDAVRTCFQKYADFKGRARRAEYWWFYLFYLAGLIAFSFLDAFLDELLGAVPFFLVVFILAMFLPVLAVSVRRLHDIDRSGWWLLIGLIPLVGAFILIYFFIQAGTAGPNQFGPDPLADELAA